MYLLEDQPLEGILVRIQYHKGADVVSKTANIMAKHGFPVKVLNGKCPCVECVCVWDGCAYMHAFVCACVYAYMHAYVCAFVHACIRACLCMCMCLCVFLSQSLCVCMCVCVSLSPIRHL